MGGGCFVRVNGEAASNVNWPAAFYNKGVSMQFGVQVVYGFLFGVGIILASAFMRVALHLSVCG